MNDTKISIGMYFNPSFSRPDLTIPIINEENIDVINRDVIEKIIRKSGLRVI